MYQIALKYKNTSFGDLKLDTGTPNVYICNRRHSVCRIKAVQVCGMVAMLQVNAKVANHLQYFHNKVNFDFKGT